MQLPASIKSNIHSDNAGENFRMFILDEAAQQKELQGFDIIRLTLGKSDLPLHDDITNAIVKTTKDAYRNNLVFPEGLPELRNALSCYYSELVGTTIPYERIIIDAGTSSLYPSLFQLILKTGSEVLLPLPYYPLYRISSLLAGTTIRHYRINTDTMQIDMESYEANLNNKTRIVVVNSPGNPLGNIITREEISRMLEILPEQAYLVFDEIYENTMFEEQPSIAPMLLSQIDRLRNRIIVTNSFSKGYRMYTKRVGWCILPDHIVNAMRIILHHTRLTVDPAVQYAAVEALKHPEEIQYLREVHLRRWRYAKHVLSAIPHIRLFSSSGGFYCTIDCREFMKAYTISNCLNLALDLLDKTGVATVPGEDFGLPGTLRISFTSSRFNEAMNKLVHYFARDL